MKISGSRTVGITGLVLMLWVGPGWGDGTNPTVSDTQNNTAGGTVIGGGRAAPDPTAACRP